MHFTAIQLQAGAVKLTSTATNRTTASAPQANASPETTIRSALILAAAIALTPVWYVGLPITLPISVFLANGLKGLFFPTGGIRQLAFFSVAIYAIAPVLAIAYAFGPFAPSAAASRPATQSSAVAQTPRQDQRATGVAGSRRTVNPTTTADRRPATHRSAKSTNAPSPTKKHRGTAGSARPTKNN
ncbi:hypothetical protein EV580_5816 [Mycobacterium sp. BK086]|uniref:hypothetical protein n=1 Tax=Mycobacterium sp. BK086 TaxID=2512165 RepID=UPI001060892C|nr:hypothetical protein [Mycobacterium sp. BK086]TDO08244.1 hypothetical protein EV580_5816 [Mycobacterium sp. BK086]